MAQLTAEQKKDYIESPYHCPFCGAKAIKTGKTRKVAHRRLESNYCLNCEAKWTDVYTLYTTEEGNIDVDMEIEAGMMSKP